MTLDSRATFKDQEEKQTPFLEVFNAEKHLWTLIHSKGLLHREVQDLYYKARSGYEKIILDDHEEVELQDVEYSLWKLHYKHIDEFRKLIRQTSANAGSAKSATPQNVTSVQSIIDSHMEQFKSFLADATEFYNDLIKKLRRHYGLPEDPLVYETESVSCVVDEAKFHKCQYSCHRFLICLGDLARYRELFKKPNFQRCNWSVAAAYYFRAKLVWPDSGNPQNQLALLATYIGDEFLALYHCIRSLAIKEPFPDASDNLILLFEKNRSSHLNSLLKEAHFNFLNPSERSVSVTGLPSRNGSINNDIPQSSEHASPARRDLWPLFVRLISSFFIEFRVDEYNFTFASTMKELDFLLELDDTKLKASLDSYQLMDPSRIGPYRALQIVSVLIFIIDSLTKSLEHNQAKEKTTVQQPTMIQSALIAAFICLGRLVERCTKGTSELSPLLPAVLVFVEWLVDVLAEIEPYTAHEEVRCALSYFIDTFIDLLNQLLKNKDEVKTEDSTALWEDHELRGFTPMDHAHKSLKFTTDPQLMGNADSGQVCRVDRIFHSAMQIVERSGDNQKWIFYDKLGRKFYTSESKRISGQREAEAEATQPISEPSVNELHQDICEITKENADHANGGNQSCPSENSKSVVDEEEVILFKPIMRYNSAPLSTFMTKDEISMQGVKDQNDPSAECLRRSTSLLVGQSQSQTDPLSFCSNASNFRSNRPFKQQEPLLKDTAMYPAGPPSLSAWVLNREMSNIEKEKGTRDFRRPGLDPIHEIPSPSLAGLSISDNGSGLMSATIPYTPPVYSAPMPSAPLLPDDAIWFTGNSSSFPDHRTSGHTRETDGILGASPASSYTNWPAAHGPLSYGPTVPDFIEGYQPVVGMSSSEWLHQYTNQNLERASSQAWPVHFYAPNSPGSFYTSDTPMFDLCDRWGNPLGSNRMVYLESPQLHPSSALVYGAEEQGRDKFFHSNLRQSPYGCGAVTDLKAEQPPLLQYLKEREWQFQRQSQVRGPTYMGN